MPKFLQPLNAILFVLVLTVEPSLAQQPRNVYQVLEKVVRDELKETNTPRERVEAEEVIDYSEYAFHHLIGPLLSTVSVSS